MLVGIATIANMMTISTHGGIAFADPQHCDRPGWPLCYSVGFDNGKANPETSCPSGHNANFVWDGKKVVLVAIALTVTLVVMVMETEEEDNQATV